MEEPSWMQLTEDEWLRESKAYAMFQHVLHSGRATSRKLRLFSIACCRRIWQLFPDQCCRTAIEVAEQFADGLADEGHLKVAYNAGLAVVSGMGQPWDAEKAAGYHAVLAASFAACFPEAVGQADDAWCASTEATKSVRAASRVDKRQERDFVGPERAEQADLLRDIFGNPFRSYPVLDPRTLSADVVALAESIYEERKLPEGTFDGGLAVLADALLEAGCTDQEVLGHLQEPKRAHVRGCWVLDLLLGKE